MRTEKEIMKIAQDNADVFFEPSSGKHMELCDVIASIIIEYEMKLAGCEDVKAKIDKVVGITQEIRNHANAIYASGVVEMADRILVALDANLWEKEKK